MADRMRPSVEKLAPMSSDELTRNGTTVTMQLSPEQYERLFFQPEKPKGDLSQRFGTFLDHQDFRSHIDGKFR